MKSDWLWMTWMAVAICVIACESNSSQPTVGGTETGNALTVRGDGARKSAGFDIETAVVEFSSIEAQVGDCETWSEVAQGGQVNVLAQPFELTLDTPVCGVRLNVSRATANGSKGNRTVRAQAESFAIEVQYKMLVASPDVELRVGRWLRMLSANDIQPGDPEAAIFADNVVGSAVSTDNASKDDDSGTDEDAGSDENDESDESDESNGGSDESDD